MCMCEQWRLHCASQWGWWTLLSEHVHCVAVTFKMTEQVEQQICIQFYVKLEHSSSETIWMTQKAAAVGNWWLAASPRQRACSCITSCAVFWWNIKSPRWLSPPTAQIWCPATSGFSRNKSPLKGKRFQTIDEIQENTLGQLMVMRKLCEVPRCLLWRRLRHHCPVYNISCISYLLQ